MSSENRQGVGGGLVGGMAFFLSLVAWLVVAGSLDRLTGRMPSKAADLPRVALVLLGLGGFLALIAALTKGGRVVGIVTLVFFILPFFIKYH